VVAQATVGGARTSTLRGRFIGRSAELSAVRAAFESGESLVTLVGVGGIGKSRCAAEYATLFASDFAGGVLRCDLCEARAREDVIESLARVLGVAAAPSAAQSVDVVGAALAARGAALLVLDNFEQLVAHAPSTIERWLVLAPELRVLVSSRERLRIEGEVVIALDPLGLSARDSERGSEAVELFVDRARRARRDFALTAANAEQIEAIVVSLDGLPLAIELAAARVGMLDLHTLRERLRSPLELLAHGPRGASTRRSTIRGALDWSWSLLAPDERVALAQCSVFRGGFDLAAAEAVIQDAQDARGVLELLQSLHDKSLLRAESDERGGTRFGLFVAVREYAAERLAERDPSGETAARHGRYFGRLARERRGASRPVALLGAERENLVAAAEHGIDRGDEGALWAVVGLDATLSGRLFDAPTALIDAAWTRCDGPSVDPALRGWLTYMRVRTRSIERGRYSEDELDEAQRAVALGVQSGDAALESTALRATAHLHLAHGDCERGVQYAERALAVLGRDANPALRGAAASTLGSTLLATGRVDEAPAALELALTLHRAAGHTVNEDLTRSVLGAVYVERGDHGRARACLSALIALRDRRAALAHSYLGLLAHDEGDFAGALAHFSSAEQMIRALGAEPLAASYEGYQGAVLADMGALEAAREKLSRALAVLRIDGGSVGLFLAQLGAVEAKSGRVQDAERALDEADRVHGEGNDRSVPVAKALRGFLWLARARDAEARGDCAGAAEYRAQAERLTGELGGEAERAVVLRIALRALRRELGARGALSVASEAREVMVVHANGDWFEPPGGARVECYARPVLRALLRALVAQHVAAPSEPIATAALLSAGWPGQKMQIESAKARLHTALKVLRQLGMREHVRATGGGYALDGTKGLRIESDRG
jgi:predicted ATPase